MTIAVIPEGEGSQVTVVESGFAGLAAPETERAELAAASAAAWANGLALLRALAAAG